ncbi:MAG: molybdopterin-dependent oxidoreductase [Thermoplasmata archaeon]|nr:MAG: molybdopterin-dependent oxidoreductase [Thermoplasmata archaeon]
MSKYWKVFVTLIVIMIIVGSGIIYWIQSSDDITPNDEFFKVSIGPSPEIDIEYWKLKITGLVENPINLTYDNITSFPDTSAVVTLKCVSGPYGTAEWTGVKLNYILNLAGIKPGAKEVIFYAEDGFSSSLTVEDAKADDVILAYVMNGETLPVDHGYPLRLVVPGKYGYKWVKWITEIEVVDYDYKGYWESRGWDDDADITPFSQWWPHAALLSIAAVFGALSTVSGLKFSKHTKFWKKLPFSRRTITFVTFMYLAILFSVFFFWALSYYLYRGTIFQTNHGLLALAVIILHSIGGITGLAIRKGKERLRIIHLFSNLLGYLLLIGAIITGLILSLGTGV